MNCATLLGDRNEQRQHRAGKRSRRRARCGGRTRCTTAALNSRCAMPKWMKIGVTRRHTCPLMSTPESDPNRRSPSLPTTGTIVSHGNTGPSEPASRPNVAGKHSSDSADQNGNRRITAQQRSPRCSRARRTRQPLQRQTSVAPRRVFGAHALCVGFVRPPRAPADPAPRTRGARRAAARDTRRTSPDRCRSPTSSARTVPTARTTSECGVNSPHPKCTSHRHASCRSRSTESGADLARSRRNLLARDRRKDVGIVAASSRFVVHVQRTRSGRGFAVRWLRRRRSARKTDVGRAGTTAPLSTSVMASRPRRPNASACRAAVTSTSSSNRCRAATHLDQLRRSTIGSSTADGCAARST